MKNILITILFLGFSLTWVKTAKSQTNSARMDKDLDIYEKVVGELFRNSGFSSWTKPGAPEVTATYIQGYGVIVNIPGSTGNSFSMNMNFNRDFEEDIRVMLRETKKNMKGAMKEMRDSETALREAEIELEIVEDQMNDGRKKKVVKKEIKQDDKKDIKNDKNKKVVIIRDGDVITETGAPVPPEAPRAPKAPGKVFTYNYHFDDAEGDSASARTHEKVINLMKQALRSYGDLISQLAPGEKIMLVYDENAASPDHFPFNGTRSREKITVESGMDDITSFRSGKLDENAFNSRVRVNKGSLKNSEQLDYQIFAGVLETVFSHSEESSYRMRGDIRYTVLDGFGVIYTARMKSHYAIPKSETPNAKPQDPGAADRLTKALKEAILDYGRSLRSLGDDRFILLNLELSEDGVKKHYTVKLSKATITKYEKELITREKALQEIAVTSRL